MLVVAIPLPPPSKEARPTSAKLQWLYRQNWLSTRSAAMDTHGELLQLEQAGRGAVQHRDGDDIDEIVEPRGVLTSDDFIHLVRAHVWAESARQTYCRLLLSTHYTNALGTTASLVAHRPVSESYIPAHVRGGRSLQFPRLCFMCNQLPAKGIPN